MTYRVVHRTEYRYESVVSSSYGELYLLPRDVPGQVCRASHVTIEPAPDDYRERIDFYGNRVAYFAVTVPHTKLTVIAESTVDVSRPRSLPLSVDQPWDAIRDRLMPVFAVDNAPADLPARTVLQPAGHHGSGGAWLLAAGAHRGGAGRVPLWRPPGRAELA